MNRRRVGVLALGLSLAQSLGPWDGGRAIAADTDFADPRDADGKLDVKAVELDHTREPLVWKIQTYGSWTIKEIWDRGYVAVDLDTTAGPEADHYLLARSDGRHLKGSLFRIRDSGRDARIGPVDVRHPDTKTVRIEFDLGRIGVGAGRTSFGWDVLTIYSAKQTCRNACFDMSPDAGMVTQPIDFPLAPVEPSAPEPAPDASDEPYVSLDTLPSPPFDAP